MKQGRTDRDWAVVSVMTFVAGAFFVWALMSGNPASGKAPRSDWPAWVQAIGSVVAILVAFHVPFRLHKETIRSERKKDLLRARGLAMVVLPDIEAMKRDLEEALKIFRIEHDLEICLSVADGFTSVPDPLRSRVTILHELGDPAMHLQLAIDRTDRAKQEIGYAELHYANRGRYFCEHTGDEDPMPDPENYQATLEEAAHHIRIAATQIRTMFDT